MSSPLIISVSGLRGEIGSSLTPNVLIRYALVYSASVSDSRPFVITRDGRRSGRIYSELIRAALNATGRSTLDGGIAATPTTGILVRRNNAAGGIQISASHNPARFNGLKLFSEEGRVIPGRVGETILARYRETENSEMNDWRDVDHLGRNHLIEDTISAHLETVLQTVDANLIRQCRFKVLLDSNHGAGSMLGKPLLEALGCQTVFCGDLPDGAFEHTPEPIEENLVDIGAKVREAGAQIGFCQDPDADRLAFIDANGHYPGEEYTIALCALNKFEKALHPAPITVNCASSRMSIDLARKFGSECFRSSVGEANVVDKLLETDSFFAGEGNGGPIDPQVGLVRDSFVGMANLLELMARKKKSIAELVAEIPAYSIVKRKRALAPDLLEKVFENLEKKYAGLEQSRADGLRLDRDNSWVLIRASNTEPIIRIIAEAETAEEANQFCDEIEETVRNIENGGSD